MQKLDLDTSNEDAYQFFRAKYFLEQGNLTAVEESLQNIDEKSKYFLESLLIRGLSLYRQGKIDEAAVALNTLLTKSDRSIPIRTVSAITLARIYFQKSQYKEAFTAYGQVDKSHPLWLSAMVEQAVPANNNLGQTGKKVRFQKEIHFLKIFYNKFLPFAPLPR